MTTVGASASEGAPEVLEQPLYFSTEPGLAFGWLHRVAGERGSDVGVVICKPFGYEALSGHRSLRAFARTLAASGAPTLTLDYRGTGDSEDLDPEADQIEQWCQDIVSAVAKLRRAAGVRRVCLLGFRLGGLLAAMAANRTAVDALILVAPVMRGSTYLRQLRTAEALMGRNVDAIRGVSSNAAMEINGYQLSSASVLRLNELDLGRLPQCSPAAALIVDSGAGLPAARAWASSLTARGVETDCVVQRGFVEMMMLLPHKTQIPWAMISSVQSWLLRFMASASQAKSQLEATPTTSLPVSCLTIATDAGLTLTEQPVYFGRDARLFGVLTEPPPSSRPVRGVVLVNAGADSHVGLGRLYVKLARQWAQEGCVALRIDLEGLGDSKTLPGRPDNEVYPPGAVDDIRSAVELLRERYRVTEVSVGGMCSGGYHAFRAAAAGVAVSRVFMVNPEAFLWQEGEIYAADVVRVPGVLRAYAFSLQGWKRLLTGRIDLVRQTGLLSRRLLWSLTAGAQRLLRILHIRVAHDVGRVLEEVTARGVEIIVVFSRGEPGLKLLELQAGDALRTVSERFRLHVVDGADHMFSQSAARAVLRRLLSHSLPPVALPDLGPAGVQAGR